MLYPTLFKGYIRCKRPTIWSINTHGEKNQILSLIELHRTNDGKKTWFFASDYSNPSLSFFIERTI